MSQGKLARTVTVLNPEGVHARAATQIRQVVLRYRATVEISKDGAEPADATSVLHLLSLCAGQGDALTLEASGEDAAAALDALIQLFASHFENVA